MAKREIKLGDLARDMVTGFTGVVTADTSWLNGCRRLQLQPRDLKEGAVKASEVFDAEQLELVEASAVVIKKEVPTGGGRDDASALRR